MAGTSLYWHKSLKCLFGCTLGALATLSTVPVHTRSALAADKSTPPAIINETAVVNSISQVTAQRDSLHTEDPGIINETVIANAVVQAMSPSVAKLTLPATINESLPGTIAAIGLIENRKLSLAEASKDGLLPANDIVYVLGQEEFTDRDIAPDLAGLLLQSSPDAVKDIDNLSPGVRLWLADYYHHHHDHRAIPLFHLLITQAIDPATQDQKNPQGITTNNVAAWYYEPAVTRLCEFYLETGQYQIAIDTYLKAVPHSKDPAYLADWQLGLGRSYAEMGDQKRATEYYAQVAQYGEGWFTGLALLDQARMNMAAGDYEKARELLQQPIQGKGAEQVKLALTYMLSYSYYRTGEFGLARKYSKEVIEHYKSLSNSITGLGLDSTFSTAQETLAQIDQWSKKPILAEPQELHTIASPAENPGGVVTRRLYLYTSKFVPLKVISNNPFVKVQVSNNKPVDNLGDLSAPLKFHVEQEVLIQIAPEALQKGFSATLSVQSPAFPNYQMSIPLHIQVEGA